MTDKRKIKYLALFPEIYNEVAKVNCKNDDGSLSGCPSEILETTKKLLIGAGKGLVKLGRKFMDSFPQELYDKVYEMIKKKAEEDEDKNPDNFTFKPENECYGFQVGYPCSYNKEKDDAEILEKNTKLGQNSDDGSSMNSDKLEFCCNCWKRQ